MKKITLMATAVALSLSLGGIAHAADREGGNGDENVQSTRSYQEFVDQKSSPTVKTEVKQERTPSAWDGFQKADEAD